MERTSMEESKQPTEELTYKLHNFSLTINDWRLIMSITWIWDVDTRHGQILDRRLRMFE